MGDKKYKRYGAYCLLLYKCEHCKKIELVWNSWDYSAPIRILCGSTTYMCGLMWLETDLPQTHVRDFTPPDTMKVLVDPKLEIPGIEYMHADRGCVTVMLGKEYREAEAIRNNYQVSSVPKGEENMKIEITKAEGRINKILSKLDEIERVKLEPISLLLPKLEAEKEKLFALYTKNEEIVSLERGKALRSIGAFSKDINNERIKLLNRKDEVEAMVDQLKLIIEKAESDTPQESRTVKLKSVLKYFLIGGFVLIVYLKDPIISLYLAILIALAWLTDRYIT